MHQYDEITLEYLQKAEELKLRGQFEEAIKMLQKLIIHEPECFEAFEELGDNYLSMRELKKAEKALKQSLKINTDSPNAFYLLGFLYSLEQRWSASVEELEKADQLFPNHPEILRCLGWSFYNANRKTQGIAVLERSRNLSPKDPNILCDLGVCHMNSANFQEAEKLFQEVLKIAPQSDQAQDSLEFLKMIKEGKQAFESPKKKKSSQ